MSSKALSLFADFVTATNEKQISGPNEILNEVSKQTYVLGRMMKGAGVAKTLRSGSSITERLILTATTQGDFYQPNQTFTPQIEDVLDKVSFNWRFFHNMWVYTDHEVELNEGGDQFTQFKNLRDAKRAAVMGETYNKMEEALFTLADNEQANMESATGTDPYSINAFIAQAGSHATSWTTVAGVDPDVRSRWQNQYQTYVHTTISDTLIPAFDSLWRKVDFKSPGPLSNAKFGEMTYDKFMILAGSEGANKYAQITRDSNDRLASPTDLGQGYIPKGSSIGATYLGIPVEYVTAIDTVMSPTTGQPPFFFINSEHLYPVFHEKRYFKELEPMRSPNQPYTWVVHTDVWYQLVCTSRQRQGIVRAA